MGKCNIPTCRSQDPSDCVGCAGKDPVPRYVKIGKVIAVIEEDQGLSFKVRPIMGSLASNSIPKTECEIITNERLLHAIKTLQEFENGNEFH